MGDPSPSVYLHDKNVPGLPLPFFHTASDQKLNGGKAWEQGAILYKEQLKLHLCKIRMLGTLQPQNNLHYEGGCTTTTLLWPLLLVLTHAKSCSLIPRPPPCLPSREWKTGEKRERCESIRNASGHEVDVGGEGPIFKNVRTKLESEFLTGQNE